ncbi:Endo-1,4-beta-xylanase A precursor [Sedimentisphaera cyanobacteriorum]|uniref:Beta-xylanase n=1 Tax=Sedimentisphaera cyanobacteriorum TaxID=1940790 RepID=A0A1Q2HS53_9BACT|nr:endo-1,4-beta-xylanase [Sedimentisphaera cyanobacteriorum]AQQ10161.1 Endo-1,4-beta-xylanase A precursor [Sedimentisphaera cyanobacteriorum]
MRLWFAALFAAVSLCFAAEENSLTSLKDVFKDDFHIGATVNRSQIYGRSPKAVSLLREQFNSITPENVMKWSSIHPEPDEYNFEPADKYASIGAENSMFVVGHTLIWHNQTPDWVFKNADGSEVSREELLKRMKEHIFKAAGRYKGKVHGWDVVNEAIEDNGSLRNTKWREIIGDDYIAKAFEYAHQAAPEAELYYNDYNMYRGKKRKAAAELAKKLQSKGIRIDGIGIQGHWGLSHPPSAEIQKSIDAFSNLGLKVMITELDLTVLPSAWEHRGADISQNYELRNEINPFPNGLPANMHRKLAKRYKQLFVLFSRNSGKLSRITFWGVHDGCSWRNNWPVRGRTDYPLLFNRNCKPKPAFEAVLEAGK